jgi:hypothetical protein
MPPSLVVRIAGNAADLRKELQDTEKSIQSTSAQVQKLANSFNGDRMITHAHNVTAAIKEVGVTTLTASQSSRNLELLERAMDKMRRTGEEIPPSMKRTAEQLQFMARSSDLAEASKQKLTHTYQKFDGVLKLAGINLDQEVRALQDVSDAMSEVTSLSGSAATGIGLVASAASVAAAAFAGWKIGEHIDNTYKLSDAIARGTAALMGYGDVAEQTALAAADANDAGLKHAEIVKQQEEAVRFYTQAAQDESNAIKENWRITEGNTDAFRQLQQQLDASAKKRKDDALATFQASQAQSIFGQATDETTTKIAAQTSALEAQAASIAKIAEASVEAQRKIDEFMKAPTLNDRQPTTTTSDLGPLSGYALEDVVNRYRLAGEKDPNAALRRALASLEAQEGRYRPTDNASFFSMQRDQVLLAQLRQMFGSDTSTPGFANGVTNFGGGMAVVGERGPELVRLPSGSDVIPNHQIGTTVNNNININLSGMVGNRHELGQMVADALLHHLKSGGFIFPAQAG